MYAQELMTWLHERLGERGDFDSTRERFSRLRGFGLLPRGRENAAVRLSDIQIASAVLSFAHPLVGFSGHGALILGDLRPVGGAESSFRQAGSLKAALADLIGSGDPENEVLQLTLSVERDYGDDDYRGIIDFKRNKNACTTTFVSKYATSLQSPAALKSYAPRKLNKTSAHQRSFSSEFFTELSRSVSISRQLNRPPKIDWQDYETEEQKEAFYRALGATRSSSFLNLRVDAQVTWPKEPTRLRFGEHHIVLFPKTKDNSHSVSIDINNEKLSTDDARTLINRLLSIMCWHDDQPASLHEGWSGNPVPVPVLKRNLAFATTSTWTFQPDPIEDETLARCLGYYRDGLNAASVGLVSHSVLSFFRVFETRYDTGAKVAEWINMVFPRIRSTVPSDVLDTFDQDQATAERDAGTYVYKNCRVATAHASRQFPSDPENTEEARRLHGASEVIKRLARYFIEEELRYAG